MIAAIKTGDIKINEADYKYNDVPDFVFKNLKESESIGSFISHNVAKVFTYEKIKED
jgi:hypothetical protein